VHCLVGENGAGKSTLMRILAGAVRKDAGEILIDGEPMEGGSPLESRRKGVGIIYQDFRLVEMLTVAENIFLGHEPVQGLLNFIDRQSMHAEARKVLAQLGEEMDTREQVGSLSAARRQIVEIAKALSLNVRILVMDEPTAALTEREIRNLFKIILRLKREGVGIVYVSHRLQEIFEIGDRATVVRDGRVVQTTDVRNLDRDKLIHWMVGRTLEQEFPLREAGDGTEILKIEGLSAGRLRDINLSVRRGEILGIAGLVGAGRTELARVIFGAASKEAGSMTLDSAEYSPRSPREAIEAGVGLLTEDRNRYGLIKQMNVRENVTLANLAAVVRNLRIDQGKEKEVTERYAEQLRLKAPSTETRVEALSGGNRQKVILARWLFTQSKLLLFDEPTAGIDVGAKYDIYLLMNELVRRGVGVVMISSELPELLGMCARIAVMCEGRITGVVDRGEATQEKILILATQREEFHVA
jgi:ribose transport system ATP-binding protein